METPPPEFCRDAVFDLPGGFRLAASVWSSQRNSAATRILALHGVADNAATWDVFLAAVFAVAPDAFEVVALDLPGHGFSDHWDGRRSHSLLTPSAPDSAASSLQQCPNATDYLRRHLNQNRRVVSPKTIFPSIESATTARMKGLFPLSEPAARTLIRRSIVPVPSPPSTAATAAASATTSGFVWSSDPLAFSLPRYLYSSECVVDILGAIRVPTLTIWGCESGAMARYDIKNRVKVIKGDVTLPSTATLAVTETLLWLKKRGVTIPFSGSKNAKDELLATVSNSKRVTRVELTNGSRARQLDSSLAARL
ncbi:hypothetical protein DFJ73DRAFT_793579 [Zopfochytrium polystomum]|nr:hypothetical protein DFJ73DRAFT_793579 [Zopfochytrium polystomum]